MTEDLKTWLPLGLSTLTALFAIWIGQRARRQDARRTFVAFALKQRADLSTQLLASMTHRVHILDEAAYWRSRAVESADPKFQQFAKQKMLEVLGEPVSSSTIRMNDAWAAAHTVFSDKVLKPGEALVRMGNEAALDPGVFDRAKAGEALLNLTNAVRDELGVSEVLRYQRELFPGTDAVQKT
jgi:hypothetical protein